MISLFEISGQHPFMFGFDEKAHVLHDILFCFPAEKQLGPSPNVLVRRKLTFILIMEEFSLQHSLKSPLSKVQLMRNFPTPIIEKSVAIILVPFNPGSSATFPMFLRVPIMFNPQFKFWNVKAERAHL